MVSKNNMNTFNLFIIVIIAVVLICNIVSIHIDTKEKFQTSNNKIDKLLKKNLLNFFPIKSL